MYSVLFDRNIRLFFALGYDVEHHTISKSEIVYSCRRQDRDNICAVFLGVYALGSVMESHIISKCVIM